MVVLFANYYLSLPLTRLDLRVSEMRGQISLCNSASYVDTSGNDALRAVSLGEG